MSAKETLTATWKLCLSFTKRDWDLADYPTVIRKQVFDSGASADRQAPPYSARIVNWWVMTGLGNTPKEALQELAVQFARIKGDLQRDGKPIPRPGTKVPIEFAPSSRVYSDPELKDDFIRRVLGLDWAFISDESSLWDFHTDETNDVLITKIRDLYGVEVSDIESGNLATILSRIATHRDRQESAGL
jgi:hypothetical protein